MRSRPGEYMTAPWFLGTAFLLFALAIVEKALNLVGTSIPLIPVFPSQLLDWAATLLIFEIALTLRVILEHALSLKGDGGRID